MIKFNTKDKAAIKKYNITDEQLKKWEEEVREKIGDQKTGEEKENSIYNAIRGKISKKIENENNNVINEEDKNIEEKTIKDTLTIFHKWLHFDNDYDITIPSSYAISNFSNTDPGMLGIIAPSGGYKTEIIRAFGEEENKYIYPIDNLTARTFVSGLKNVEDIIPKLRGRLITIKDFTSLLSKKEDERVQIFSDFREIMENTK